MLTPSLSLSPPSSGLVVFFSGLIICDVANALTLMTMDAGAVVVGTTRSSAVTAVKDDKVTADVVSPANVV